MLKTPTLLVLISTILFITSNLFLLFISFSDFDISDILVYRQIVNIKSIIEIIFLITLANFFIKLYNNQRK